MNQTISASDWASERGKKWRDQLPGMEAMIQPVTAPLIEALALDGPLRIADIGCGGGGPTLAISRHAPAGSAVHGIDISPDLIELARGRADTAGGDIAFHIANAESAPPPGAPYDRLASRFGIMFFDNPPAAFSNLKSWLVPGGRIAFAVWGPPVNNPWMTSFRDVASQIVDVPPPDPDAPGPFRYAGEETLFGLLEAAGFDDLDIQPWRDRIPLAGGLPAVEAADFALKAFSLGDALATRTKPP
ncbi:class I SAM-dependent methyltransferase [Methyloceanibacter methanicus]|uniref:class I SAM-dependent methyltransferase n=1 Tax=Methyloceanibacter methanicus TaxID=1774968 RepID=UPI00195E40D8|nr:class I SAM-dependent methyltransferase [Methyloceanibacter methanicus]